MGVESALAVVRAGQSAQRRCHGQRLVLLSQSRNWYFWQSWTKSSPPGVIADSPRQWRVERTRIALAASGNVNQNRLPPWRHADAGTFSSAGSVRSPSTKDWSTTRGRPLTSRARSTHRMRSCHARNQ
jgi:hypothetical protein